MYPYSTIRKLMDHAVMEVSTWEYDAKRPELTAISCDHRALVKLAAQNVRAYIEQVERNF